jgi:hypothetical protein
VFLVYQLFQVFQQDPRGLYLLGFQYFQVLLVALALPLNQEHLEDLGHLDYQGFQMFP